MKSVLLFLTLSMLALPVFAKTLEGQSAATTLVVLLAVIALILGIAKIVKRLQLPAMGLKSGIRLVSQMPLGQKERILLLEVNNEQLLVGVTQHQINLIKKLDSKESFAHSKAEKSVLQDKEKSPSEHVY